MSNIESGDYLYLLDNGTAMISGYRGTEERLSIPSVLDGYPVSAIEAFSFSECSTIKDVIIPEGIVTIGINAFEQCTALVGVSFPKSLKSIEDSAFAGCSVLARISFSEGLESIESSAFENCISLVNIELPDSVKYIGYMAFAGCRSLKCCNIPDLIDGMHYQVFAGCDELVLTVTPGRYLEAYAMMQHVPYVLRESAEGRPERPEHTGLAERLRDVLYEMINRGTQYREIACSLPALPVNIKEERLGTWKFEDGHWVAYPGFLMRIVSFHFPEESYIHQHLQECLIRALHHPEIKPRFFLSFRMPLLRILGIGELGKKYASLISRLEKNAAIVSVREAEVKYGDEEFLFVISGDMLYIVEECWYD